MRVMSLVEMSVFIPYYLCIGTNSGGGGISRTQSCCRVKIFEDALPCDFFFFFFASKYLLAVSSYFPYFM